MLLFMYLLKHTAEICYPIKTRHAFVKYYFFLFSRSWTSPPRTRTSATKTTSCSFNSGPQRHSSKTGTFMPIPQICLKTIKYEKKKPRQAWAKEKEGKKVKRKKYWTILFHCTISASNCTLLFRKSHHHRISSHFLIFKWFIFVCSTRGLVNSRDIMWRAIACGWLIADKRGMKKNSFLFFFEFQKREVKGSRL